MPPLRRARVAWPPTLRELKELLYEVYLGAGAPSLDQIAGDIAADQGLAGAPSRDTVHRVITDGRSGQQADVVAVATVLARRAAWDTQDLAGRVRDLWVRAQMAQGAGRPVSDFRGDIRLILDAGLGVHPALDTDGARDRFGVLPSYVPREHDAHLRAVVDAAEAGRSGVAVLVGGSSTGKTRALWEAVDRLSDGWRLWHPLSPTVSDAALAEVGNVAPRTVVWLNEAQHYLRSDPHGERVAAGLRELLHDPSRAPVLVLGTLWPEHWDTLTNRTTADGHVGVRELLVGHRIDVPDSFAPVDLVALGATADDTVDPRLTQAIQCADDAQVTQYLAGVPNLMDRYHVARGAARALVHAAMDARRLGADPQIPLGWLADAAPGYLTNTEYRALAGDWLTSALAYVTSDCNGLPGILTPVNASGPRNQRTRRRLAATSVGRHSAPQAQGPYFLLADYVDQHGRHHRAEVIPPIDFWTAAAHHAHPADLTTLGDAAWSRGLYRDAAQLHKQAVAHGNTAPAAALVDHLRSLHPADLHPSRWVATSASAENPSAVVRLLMQLQKMGADEQVTTLAERAAAHVSLDNPRFVASLLQVLRSMGADEQVTTLAERAAAHASLDNPRAVASLLRVLRSMGADVEVTKLLARDPAAVASLANPLDVADLLQELRSMGADVEVTKLLARDPAALTSLNHPTFVAILLRELRSMGADVQFTALSERATSHSGVDNPFDLKELFDELRRSGADELAAALAKRTATHMPLINPYLVAEVFEELGKSGGGPATTLAERAATHIAHIDPHIVAVILDKMQEVGAADEQISALAEQAATHIALDAPHAVTLLAAELRRVGAANEYVTTLANRVAAYAAFASVDNPTAVIRLLRNVGVHEQLAAFAERAAAQIPLINTRAVIELLEELRSMGADEQVRILLAREPAAHVSLDHPIAVVKLLEELRSMGADEQVRILLAREPAAHVSLDHPIAVAALMKELQVMGADEQVTVLAKRAAAHASLNNWHAVSSLLKELQGIGANEQVTTLTQRLPAAGHFDWFIGLGENREQFRLGREPDGSTAPAWTWDDLD
ncbi:hypothetical protein [Streptomyces sp. NBC_01244]|uniref:hypothetical protein n=1 Tax=Streptomyces sp. NBC_01244 TaxID=2903797 RepID=UPI002E10D64E|nr:hypothetical protein OG247_04395 [Streptomyces sp. NBC_01244]